MIKRFYQKSLKRLKNNLSSFEQFRWAFCLLIIVIFVTCFVFMTVSNCVLVTKENSSFFNIIFVKRKVFHYQKQRENKYLMIRLPNHALFLVRGTERKS
jgi:hypothetical protein